MTTYEQYVEVMQEFNKFEQVSGIKVFTFGADIKIKAPFIVIKPYGIGNEELGLNPCSRRDTKGYSVRVYGVNHGRTESVISDFMDHHFALRFGTGLFFDTIEHTGEIQRLEDDLFEGVITAWVSSIYHK